MDMKFCHSCGMPLSKEVANQNSEDYCQYCAGENGELKSREEIQAGIAQWLKGMTPENSAADYMQRADYYMKSMPAWAE